MVFAKNLMVGSVRFIAGTLKLLDSSHKINAKDNQISDLGSLFLFIYSIYLIYLILKFFE